MTYPDNHRSAAVCQWIGMQLLGITRPPLIIAGRTDTSSARGAGAVSYARAPSSSKGAGVSESHTYKIVEVAGTSPDGVTEAMRAGVARAAETLRQVDWLEVRSIRGHVEDGQIAHFQVEMRMGFKLEDQ